MRNETPAEKGAAVKAAFTAKVELLEDWAKNGVPAGVAWPKNRTALRAWKGPDGNLRAWSDMHIDQERVGKHPDLTRRFIEAVEHITFRQTAKVDRLKHARTDAQIAAAQRDALQEQNARLLSEIAELKRRVQTLEALIQARTGS